MPTDCRIPIQSSNMYYPYGSLQPGRYSQTAITSRYGFNGMEKDNELKEEGNSLDFGARMYDSRIGRWLSVDPLWGKYPAFSSYNFASNNPLIFIDPDGEKIVVYYQGKRYPYTPGIKPEKGSPDILFKVHDAATYAMQTKTGAKVWNTIAAHPKEVVISEKEYHPTDQETNLFKGEVVDRAKGDKLLGTIYWDMNSRTIVYGKTGDFWEGTAQTGYQSPSAVLLHELGHVFFMIAALDKGLDSPEWRQYLEDTNVDLGYDPEYETVDERKVIEKIEVPFIIEINEIEGENGSHQEIRANNHKGDVEWKLNNADVNKNPTKKAQNAKF